MFPFVFVFALSFVLALAVTPLSAKLGRHFGLVDQPDLRRKHRGVIPRIGGIGLFAAFFITVIGTLILPAQWFPIRNDPNEITRLTGILLGSAFIFLAGLIDDRYELSPRAQFLAHLAASILAISFLIFIETFTNPLTGHETARFPTLIVWGLSLFWLMGMINTVNWLDGLDGLAAGVAAILCVVLAVHMLREGQASVALLPLALLGATLGFLPYNWYPARVFMGSTGAYFLGYALGTLGIVAGAKMATVLLAFGLPILDVAWQIWRRVRSGKSPSTADRGHLHFRLFDLGYSQPQIVIAYYIFSAAFGLLALDINSRLYKLLALIGLAAIVCIVLLWAERRGEHHRSQANREAHTQQPIIPK